MADMRASGLSRFVPWCLLVVVCVALPFTHWYAYGEGKRRGGGEGAYELAAVQAHGDLILFMDLLGGDNLSHVSQDDLRIYRGRLRGAITAVEGMAIPMETERGNAERVQQLRDLVDRGKELDRKLAPPPSWWDETSDGAAGP